MILLNQWKNKHRVGSLTYDLCVQDDKLSSSAVVFQACRLPHAMAFMTASLPCGKERRYLAGQGAGGCLSTQLQGPWKLLPRRLGEQGVMELKGTTANSHKSTERQGSCLQRAACYGLQGFVARLGSVRFCVPYSSPGEGFPMCPEGVFFGVCSALINASLRQGWRRGWWSKVEKLLGLLLLNSYSR